MYKDSKSLKIILNERILIKGGKLMPKITISKEMHARVVEFKHVVEAVMKEEFSNDGCAELILNQGIDSMLTDLLGPQDQTILIKSFQQLGDQYPIQVYRYVAEILKRGEAVQEQEKMRQKIIGFLGFNKTTKNP